MKKKLKKILENIRSWEITAVHKTVLPLAAATLASAATITGCVKDDLYNTPHPDKGAVAVTTDWADALGEETIPEEYSARMDGGSALVVHSRMFTSPQLLSPGGHTLFLYNEPQGIAVSGTSATVNSLADGTLEPLPEYLFSAVKELDVQPDDTLRVTVTMVRRLCPVTMRLRLTGNNAANVARVEATLGGVAGSVNLQDGSIGMDSHTVRPDVRMPADGGSAAGLIEMSCRVAGVVPQEQQLLTVTVTMDDGYAAAIVSNLSKYLRPINTGMRPVVIEGTVEAPQDGHFNGGIEDWEVAESPDVDAH